MARIIAIANQKGGIGKSTMAVNLGKALSEKDYRVLLIDLDPQGGLSAAVGIDSYSVRRSSYSLLMDTSVSMGRVILNIGPKLMLAPANMSLANAEIQLAGKQQQAERLRMGLSRNRTTFDYIIIDTPPTLGILTANAMVAATELLVPVQAQYLAMRGVRALLDSSKRIQQKLNPTLKILGLVGTLYRPDSIHAREVVEELRDVFGELVFQTILAYDEIVAEAPVAGMTLLDYASHHPAAYAYRALAQEVINRG